MARPASLPTFATNANYTAGPDNGTATKVAMTSGDTQNGNIRGVGFAPNAKKYNWWMNLVGLWVSQIVSELDILSATNLVQPFVIWRPSEPSPSGNVYATLAAAVTAALALPYRVVDVLIDTTLATSSTLTASVNLSSRVRLVATSAFTLNFGANGVLQNPAGFLGRNLTGLGTLTAFNLVVTSPTGGTAITTDMTVRPEFENVYIDPSTHGRSMLSASTDGQVTFRNCRIAGTITLSGNAQVRIEGSATRINGGTLMTSSGTLFIISDQVDVVYRPGYTGDMGPNVVPTQAMAQAWITGQSTLRGNGAVGMLYIDGGDASGAVTLASQFDLKNIYNLRCLSVTTLDIGTNPILAPRNHLNFGGAALVASASVGNMIEPTAAATPPRKLLIENTKFDNPGSSGETRFVLVSLMTWDDFTFRNVKRTAFTTDTFIRLMNTIGSASIVLNIEGNDVDTFESGTMTPWGRQNATATDANLTINWRCPRPLPAAQYNSAWDMSGTLLMFDQWQQRFPKVFPVQDTTASNIDWNFRVLWPDMPDGTYYVEISWKDFNGWAFLLRTSITVAARVVTGITLTVELDVVVFPKYSGSASTTLVTVSSGNLRFINSLWNTYGPTGAQLTIIGSNVHLR